MGKCFQFAANVTEIGDGTGDWDAGAKTFTCELPAKTIPPDTGASAELELSVSACGCKSVDLSVEATGSWTGNAFAEVRKNGSIEIYDPDGGESATFTVGPGDVVTLEFYNDGGGVETQERDAASCVFNLSW